LGGKAGFIDISFTADLKNEMWEVGSIGFLLFMDTTRECFKDILKPNTPIR